MYAIQIKNLRSKAKKHTILHNINLNIPENQIFWFIWPNGAWKTTTINCILWQFPIDNWEIFLYGEKFQTKLTKNIWYAPDEAIFYEHLSCIEHLIFFGEISDINKQQAKTIWLQLLKKLWLDYAKNRKVKEYSKWMKQRLGIAIALINDPKLLIFDEPMNWLDPLWRKLIKNLMKELRNQWKTIFFSTHILSDVEEIADQFSLIHEWKILLTKNVNELNKNLEQTFINEIKKQNHKTQIS